MLSPRRSSPFLICRSPSSAIAWALLYRSPWRETSARSGLRCRICFCLPGRARRIYHSAILPPMTCRWRKWSSISNGTRGTPAPQLENQELLELTLPALRADLEVTDTYVYEKQSPLQCPITAFAGADDPLVSQDELAGWRHHTSGDFRSHRMAGNHLYVTLPDDRFFGILSGELERHLR